MSKGRAGNEVLIIGGGPAGSAAALTLARAGLGVTLCERTEGGAFKVGESLPPAGLDVLRELGVADILANGQHQPWYGNQSAWGSPRLQTTDFIGDPRGLGWRLDRTRFEADLRDAARACGASLLMGARVAAVGRRAGQWRVSLVGGSTAQTVSAAWLLDCSGRGGWLARRLGVAVDYDDRLLAFVALFTSHAPDADSLALVEAVADGWWYTTRLPTQQRVVVAFTDSDTAMARGLGSQPGFMQSLDQTEHVRARLAASDYTLSRGPRPTPAYSLRSAQVVGDGWLAAGDAALSLDPLSSQGILTALYSGLMAGQALSGQLMGKADALNRYSEQLNRVHAAYVRHRHEFYTLEQRWPSQLFWRRRHVGAMGTRG